MGKIIELPLEKISPEHMNCAEGIKLYYRYYKTASPAEREWTLQMIGMNLMNSIANREYLHAAEPQEMLELIGYAAAKRQTKTVKSYIRYYQQLSEILEKYGKELIEIARGS